MKPFYKYSVALVMVALVIGCSTSTNITAVWRSPDNGAVRYKNLCVVAITENVTNKHVVEQEMFEQLKAKGVNASKLGELLPYKFSGAQTEKDLILEKVKTVGSDGILTFALIKQKEETRYVPGNATYAPPARYGYYGTFGGYYGYYGNQMYDPGYYTHDEVYFIETNLYDVASEKLVWSAQSKTYNPSGIQQFAEDFTTTITKQLIKSNVIVPQVK